MENNRIKPVDVANELSTSFLDYSMSVIISRALPDVRDGLKPSQRRILYAMKELNLSPGGKTRKCSKIVGDTMGNYHPHGDAAIYGTLVNMAQDWSMRDILVIGRVTSVLRTVTRPPPPDTRKLSSPAWGSP